MDGWIGDGWMNRRWMDEEGFRWWMEVRKAVVQVDVRVVNRCVSQSAFLVCGSCWGDANTALRRCGCDETRCLKELHVRSLTLTLCFTTATKTIAKLIFPLGIIFLRCTCNVSDTKLLKSVEKMSARTISKLAGILNFHIAFLPNISLRFKTNTEEALRPPLSLSFCLAGG